VAKTFKVVGPYSIVVVRGDNKVDVETGGTFTEDEIEPGCNMDLNVQAGLVKVVTEPAVKVDKAAK
jgi:hypothetical protein